MSGLYDAAREALLSGDIDLLVDDIRCFFVDAADYVVDLAAHDFLDDVPGAARVGTPEVLANITVTDGVFDADDVTFAALAGDTVEAIILYVHTGVEGTSKLLAYIDTGGGFPLTPAGTDVTITWDNGVSKIFRLVNP